MLQTEQAGHGEPGGKKNGNHKENRGGKGLAGDEGSLILLVRV